jgi:hypothetical protein
MVFDYPAGPCGGVAHAAVGGGVGDRDGPVRVDVSISVPIKYTVDVSNIYFSCRFSALSHSPVPAMRALA